MKVLPKLLSDNENSERKWNPHPESEYLSGSEFLVNLTLLNKKSFRVKPVFKSRDQVSNSYTIKKFIAPEGLKVLRLKVF